MVVAGKDKGKVGRVLKVLRKHDRVLIENVNVAMKHMRANPNQNQPGGIFPKEMPLHISNVMVMCDKCGVCKVGYRYLESTDGKKGEKVRFCRKCNEIIGQGGKKK